MGSSDTPGTGSGRGEVSGMRLLMWAGTLAAVAWGVSVAMHRFLAANPPLKF